ncbi:BTB POZ domain-containing protein [Rutstroemia sp. NJR-2017a WRK4]|nr:BTB POZ domain-containing protein [Rutstroemia sp. NJR-2017a WRK4]
MSTMSEVLATRMLESGRYSDLTIKCGGKVFRVHRNVVCLQSRPLAAHVDGVFLEAVSGEINLPDDHPAIFERLIKFLYTGDFNATPSPNEVVAEEQLGNCVKETSSLGSSHALGSDPGFVAEDVGSETVDTPLDRLTICTRIFVMAEKYDISALKTLAKTKFEALVPYDWNTSALSESLRLMYDGLPDSDRLLKDVAVAAAAGHVKELVDRGEFVALCKDNGDIAFDVLKASLSPTRKIKNCPYGGISHASRVSYRESQQEYYCSLCNDYFD